MKKDIKTNDSENNKNYSSHSALFDSLMSPAGFTLFQSRSSMKEEFGDSQPQQISPSPRSSKSLWAGPSLPVSQSCVPGFPQVGERERAEVVTGLDSTRLSLPRRVEECDGWLVSTPQSSVHTQRNILRHTDYRVTVTSHSLIFSSQQYNYQQKERLPCTT